MTETALTYLDGYCERAGDAALLAEPLNAFTNLFFIAAAMAAVYALGKLAAAHKRPPLDLWLLMTALMAIGIGSGLWHLVPNHHTVLMDVIPITLFIHIYLIAAMRRLLGFSVRRAVCWWLVYVGVSVAAQLALPPDMLNGTVMYLPTYLTMIVLAAAVYRKDQATGRTFISMVGVWSVSLVLRTVDMAVCEQLPIGTHFLWHTLNAYMLYRLLRVLIAQAENR